MSGLEDRVIAWGLLPDGLLRRVVRARLRGIAQKFDRLAPELQAARETALLAEFESGPLAVDPDAANKQHYELPPAFFQAVLGPRLKYSCCLWPEGVADLAGAEEAMLALTAERAGLADGQDVLDLGCGWGSFSLWAAERFPGSRVLAMSNSRAQRRFIQSVAAERGLANLEVVTAEIGRFAPSRRFDRVVSVEMMEHVRNHKALLERVAEWLRPDGRLFVHVFCHRRHVWAFEPGGTGGWMAEHFFSGGMMPSWDHLTRYQDCLQVLARWEVNGRDYSRTLRAWLGSLDRRREAVMPLLGEVYGEDAAQLWFALWRVFFITCEEMFALDDGREYFVGHYLLGQTRR
jgi:cyclopropane-fatty-acyl-phospholipid synthase